MIRPNTANWFSSIWISGWVTHSARTAVAAAVSFGVAGLFQMPSRIRVSAFGFRPSDFKLPFHVRASARRTLERLRFRS